LTNYLEESRHEKDHRQAADRPPGRGRLGTSVRFPRRLIAERRIIFVRVGRHVRIPEGAIDELIASGTVEPIDRRHRRGVA
jgi:excisionase family DNA binding protein